MGGGRDHDSQSMQGKSECRKEGQGDILNAGRSVYMGESV